MGKSLGKKALGDPGHERVKVCHQTVWFRHLFG